MFFAGEFKFYRPSCPDGGQGKNVFDEHFLFAAKTAADAFAEHPDLVRREVKNFRQRAQRQEWYLRAGTHVQDAGRIDPGEPAMGFQGGVLDALGGERSLVGDRGLGQGPGDIAILAMGFRHDVALRIRDAMVRRLVGVEPGRARCDRLRRIDHIRQNVVVDLEAAAAFLRGGLGFRDHGGDLLTDEADDIVQHAGVVRIHPGLLVPRGREQPVRRIFEGQHRMHAGNGQCRGLVDRYDLCVRMRRAQHLDMQQSLDHRVEGVARRAAHQLRSGGCGQAAAEGGAGGSAFDIGLAVKRVFDRAIAGAAAQIAFQRCAEILPLRLVQGCAGQDHAGGAEPALKGLRIEKRLLHRVCAIATIAREALDGGDDMVVGAEGRNQAAVHRLAIDQHCAGAAVASVAALLDAEMPELAQESPQTLSGARAFRKLLAIDLKGHGHATPCNSRRISSARRSVMCLRHAGLPWMSS